MLLRLDGVCVITRPWISGESVSLTRIERCTGNSIFLLRTLMCVCFIGCGSRQNDSSGANGHSSILLRVIASRVRPVIHETFVFAVVTGVGQWCRAVSSLWFVMLASRVNVFELRSGGTFRNVVEVRWFSTPIRGVLGRGGGCVLPCSLVSREKCRVMPKKPRTDSTVYAIVSRQTKRYRCYMNK